MFFNWLSFEMSSDTALCLLILVLKLSLQFIELLGTSTLKLINTEKCLLSLSRFAKSVS